MGKPTNKAPLRPWWIRGNPWRTNSWDVPIEFFTCFNIGPDITQDQQKHTEIIVESWNIWNIWAEIVSLISSEKRCSWLKSISLPRSLSADAKLKVVTAFSRWSPRVAETHKKLRPCKAVCNVCQFHEISWSLRTHCFLGGLPGTIDHWTSNVP